MVVAVGGWKLQQLGIINEAETQKGGKTALQHLGPSPRGLSVNMQGLMESLKFGTFALCHSLLSPSECYCGPIGVRGYTVGE